MSSKTVLLDGKSCGIAQSKFGSYKGPDFGHRIGRSKALFKKENPSLELLNSRLGDREREYVFAKWKQSSRDGRKIIVMVLRGLCKQ